MISLVVNPLHHLHYFDMRAIKNKEEARGQEIGSSLNYINFLIINVPCAQKTVPTVLIGWMRGSIPSY